LNTYESFQSQLYSLNERSFEDIALHVFRFQAAENPLYRQYIETLGIAADKIHSLSSIPFLPITFFKGHLVKSGTWSPQTHFTSSGTTGGSTSIHYIRDIPFYLNHSKKCFEHFFGPISDYNILALLPSYLERTNSSLVAMMDFFIKETRSSLSGFYLNDLEKLVKDLEIARNSRKKTILWGVTFALLDLAEKFNPNLDHCIVFETGGMKGRRTEIIREQLHSMLRHSFQVDKIYSEYGMTELLSQAYSRGGNRFFPSPWMRIMGRDMNDPFEKGLLNQTAGINVIDLANWHSVSFIETQDMGKVFGDHSFEILGRFDNSDVRGCNLMVE
jgi:phenylacetate-coenzyme A ligase PaaK-like adenylate-forming protein